jgi:hypothetical protein
MINLFLPLKRPTSPSAEPSGLARKLPISSGFFRLLKLPEVDKQLIISVLCGIFRSSGFWPGKVRIWSFAAQMYIK